MTNRKKTNKKKKHSKIIKRLWIIFGCGWVFTGLFFVLISLGWLGFMPSFEELENPKTNLATEIISEDGQILGKYYVENRSNVPFNQLPQNLVNALIATEDIRYYKHSGIDGKALARAIIGTITFSNKGGGSTITQQLAKNLFPRETDRTFIGIVFAKLKEWVVAVKLERNYSKDEIIAMYLNTVDFGNMSHGIKSAAKTYFDKNPHELTTEESALLIGMLKAPTRYNPRRNPENALNRRNTVLGQMHKYDFLTDEEFTTIKNIPIDVSKFKLQDHKAGTATYFREFIRKELTQWAKDHPKPDGSHWNIYKDGLKIYTTINYKMQTYAEEAVKEWVVNNLQPEFFKHWKGHKNAPFYRINEKETERIMTQAMKNSSRYKDLKKAGLSEKEILKNFNTPCSMWVYDGKDGEKDTIMSPWDSIRYMKSFLSCGLLAMDPSTGKVRAYVGGVNYEYFQYDHVSLAKRQVGSTFKPFIYVLAMQEGEYYPCTEIPNLPVTIEQPNLPPWTPKNSNDYKEGQMVTLSEALANSINYISAYLMKRCGPDAVIHQVRKMGITSEIPAVPAICLGACELSLYEMVGAINTFNNKGIYIKPYFITKICNSKGTVLATFTTKQEQALDEISAYKTVRLMEGVVQSGTGVRLRYRYNLDMPIAGKTGTTDNNSDGWFMGYTPMITAGAWVGCEDRAAHFRSTALGQGANTALPIWAIFIKKCYQDKTLNLSKKNFDLPQDSTLQTNLFNCREFNSTLAK
ncbi:MAG: transglycosylase domain-containing protein [Bacteroidales bacterium]|jgi:penicillin-binding protein 1A|nr:transglycosylase domain-containing protein [Bacteroidales bacterium]